MSDQTYASPGDPYWLSTRGVDSVSFNKQDAPPLAYLDKGILYELDDGVLYFNGTPLSGGGGGGDVSSSTDPSLDNAAVRFDSTTGKVIQQSNLILKDPSTDYSMEWDQYNVGDAAAFRFMISDGDNKNLTIGVNSGSPAMISSGAADNTAVGFGALAMADGCTGNVAVGVNSLSKVEFGSENTAVGTGSLFSVVSGNSNTAIGFDSSSQLQSGSENTSVGLGALYSNVSGAGNTVVGKNAAYLTTGSNNVVMGRAAAVFLTSGSDNVAIGNSAMQNMGAGSLGVAVGTGSQGATTHTGASIPCTSVGALSLGRQTSGESNNAFGYRCMEGDTALTGSFNNCFGTVSMLNATTASYNNCFGNSCLNGSNTSVGNCCFGSGSGSSLANGDDFNVFIGNGTAGVAGDSRTIRIGAPADGTGIGKPNRCFIQGISGITTAGAAVPVLVDADGQLGTISSSMKVKDNIRAIEDTSFLHSLEICNFEYKGSTQKQAGVIAEVVEQIKPELVITQGNGVKTVDYQYLFICALRELQLIAADLRSLRELR